MTKHYSPIERDLILKNTATLKGSALKRVAKQYGISYGTVARWRVEKGMKHNPVPITVHHEDARIAQLQKQVEVLTNERDMLARTAAYFARRAQL